MARQMILVALLKKEMDERSGQAVGCTLNNLIFQYHLVAECQPFCCTFCFQLDAAVQLIYGFIFLSQKLCQNIKIWYPDVFSE